MYTMYCKTMYYICIIIIKNMIHTCLCMCVYMYIYTHIHIMIHVYVSYTCVYDTYMSVHVCACVYNLQELAHVFSRYKYVFICIYKLY